MNDESEEKPKIIVDEDWKSQVAKEREKAPEPEQEQPQEFPEPSFLGLVQSLGAQAMAALSEAARMTSGQAPEPPPGQELPPPKELLEFARHYVDTLGVLEAKTKGNLTDEESQTLTALLHELRMTCLAIASQIN